MESIAVFIFTTQLFLSLVSDIFLLLLRLTIGTKTFFTTFFFTLFMATCFTAQMVVFPDTGKPKIILQKDQQTAETEIVFWEGLASVMPNRDTFLNLEKLYTYLDELDQAKEYRRRAFTLDPNNPMFKDQLWLWEKESSISATASSENK